MPVTPRLSILLASLALLVACGPGAQAIAPSAPLAPTAPAPASTALPAATAVPLLATDLRVAGVAVGGLTRAEALRKLEADLAELIRPIELQAGDETLVVKPEQIDLALALDQMLAQAEQADAEGRVPLKLAYDEAKLRAALEDLASRVNGTSSLTVLSDTLSISRSFALVPGDVLDVEQSIAQIDERLSAPGSPRRITLALTPDQAASARPSVEQLQSELETLAEQWRGVVGVYVYDLASGQEIASLNKNTVFSAASTIKTPIMLNAYANLPSFSRRQQEALKKMIVESDNLEANLLLAAAAGGTTTEAAFEGAEQMSDMLKQELGLKHTYLYIPFEATDFIKLYKPKYRAGPEREGDPPYTESGRYLRTTPYEMAQIYLEIERCSQGQGVLLERFDGALTPGRCVEMLRRLEQNGDEKRMMSGLPEGVRVAHKSGWVPPEVQADVGIVRSDGGDFLVSIYVYQPGERYPDRVAEAFVGNLTRLVYTYYNPAPIDAAE